jgi:hypothetical protein
MTMSTPIQPERQIEPDGAPVDVFALPADEASLEKLLRGLFTEHWQDITFGPLIQGAAWEIKPAQAPDQIGMMDGYLTIAFGVPHFHICIGEHKGTRASPVSPELAHHRRTARAELYRRISRDGSPVSWGLRLFNGKGEQQITVLLPNPFLDGLVAADAVGPAAHRMARPARARPDRPLRQGFPTRPIDPYE